MKPLLNGKQTAERLCITDKTLRTWLRQGTCPVAPIPGMKPAKWRAADVDAWIAGGAAQ